MKKVKNILLLLTAIFTLGCSQTIVFEDIQTPTPTPTPKPEPEPEPEPTPNDKQLTSAPYAVGDYYNDGTKEGVVFEVSADGTSGKIVSMMQSTGTLPWSSDETEQKRLIGADSETDGAANMAVVKAISGWETKYPAFKWCADLGDDWYLPAKEELRTISNNKDKLDTNLTDMLSSHYHWSSTEYDYQYSDGRFYAWYVNLCNGYTNSTSKNRYYYVRAVATFGDAQQSDPTPEPTEPANNEIWYTSTDGNVVTPNKSDVFDSKITSNTYENGKGVIKFETGLTQIGNWAFSDCVKFKTITFPNSLKRIGEFSFYGCTNIAEIIIPQGVVSIGSNAFNCSTGLARVTIPNSVTSIGLNPFQACSGMAEFNGKFASEDGRCLIVNNELISFAPAELTEYTLPESVVYIADNSFIDCTKIEKIIIPNNVSRIGEWSFYRCESITSIDIPESMKEVKEYAFCQCEKLNSVLCASPTPFTLGASVFDSNASDRKIYVPASSVSAYKSASGWSTYADAIVADPSTFTSAPYAVGDYYNDGTKEGVVFEVWDNGNSGKIVSMTESTTVLQWSSDETEQKRLIGADSETDGAYNTAKVKAISGWESKYPAFKWCADLGDGWYLPAKEELITMYNN